MTEHAFAVVESVEEDGLRLKFDGEEQAGEKHYKCNTFFVFKPGDRVYCAKDSGSYVAICKIGAPAKEITFEADYAEEAGSATTAEKADAVKNSSVSTRRFLMRKATGSDVIQIRETYDGDTQLNPNWYPVNYPLDEGVATPSPTTIIRFRSTYDGKLQFCMPYRNSYTWYTVATV